MIGARRISLVVLLVALAAVPATGAARAATPSACGIVPAAGKKWYVTIDASCATAKAILAKVAAKAKGSPAKDVAVDLGKPLGWTCEYRVIGGNAGINCSRGEKFMRASWVRA